MTEVTTSADRNGVLANHAAPPVVAATGLSVRYGSVTALSDFTFAAEMDQITGVIGPNGSGKTTFLNALTGAVPFQTGTISVLGHRVEKVTSASMHRFGVSRTFQNLQLIDDLTVEANVRLGASSSRHAMLIEGLLGMPRARRENRERTASARVAMEILGLTNIARRYTSELSYGTRRRVEVARALASSPKVLFLDEPTAGMGPNESLEFSELVRHVARDLAVNVILIEHDMTVIRAVCDSVYVLANGIMIDQGPPTQVLDNPVVRQVYLGDFEVKNA